MNTLQTVSKKAPAAKPFLRHAKERVLLQSLKAAIREQGLEPLCARLRQIAPDVAAQYSSFDVDSEYLETKVRGQHAFQVSLALEALKRFPGDVVDIGDSAGTHIGYLKAIGEGKRRYVSVNLDPVAVEKIKAKGLEAVESRAEDLGSVGIKAEVVLCLETLEHLPDPINFLHDLAAKTPARCVVLTVPYVTQSRLGLHHLRAGLKNPVGAETTHLFELSPKDLRLLFSHCGWKVELDRIYRQYPSRSLLRATKALWKKTDFEGFYGAVLTRDDAWSSLYQDWR